MNEHMMMKRGESSEDDAQAQVGSTQPDSELSKTIPGNFYESAKTSVRDQTQQDTGKTPVAGMWKRPWARGHTSTGDVEAQLNDSSSAQIDPDSNVHVDERAGEGDSVGHSDDSNATVRQAKADHSTAIRQGLSAKERRLLDVNIAQVKAAVRGAGYGGMMRAGEEVTATAPPSVRSDRPVWTSDAEPSVNLSFSRSPWTGAYTPGVSFIKIRTEGNRSDKWRANPTQWGGLREYLSACQPVMDDIMKSYGTGTIRRAGLSHRGPATVSYHDLRTSTYKEVVKGLRDRCHNGRILYNDSRSDSWVDPTALSLNYEKYDNGTQEPSVWEVTVVGIPPIEL